MNEEPKDVRLPLMVTRSEAEAIDDWRFQNRVATRAEAIRRLIKLGLEAASKGSKKTSK
jgi:hypothetical protein